MQDQKVERTIAFTHRHPRPSLRFTPPQSLLSDNLFVTSLTQTGSFYAFEHLVRLLRHELAPLIKVRGAVQHG